MNKLLAYILLLFWWCLLFPSDSYLKAAPLSDIIDDPSAIIWGNKEIRFKLLEQIPSFR